MQLNDLLQEHTLKSISQRTNISEENLEALFDESFEYLTKVKALGFLSIIEREYGIDVTEIKKRAKEYYETHNPDEDGLVMEQSVQENKRSGKKWMVIVVLLALIAAVWVTIEKVGIEKIEKSIPFLHGKTEVQQTTEVSDSENDE